MSGSRRGTKFGVYPSYLFKDHDPILDQIDTLFELAGKGADVRLKKVAEETKVSTSTIHNWRKRKTKKPQFATTAAVINYLGGELTVTFAGRKVYGSQRNNG